MVALPTKSFINFQSLSCRIVSATGFKFQQSQQANQVSYYERHHGSPPSPCIRCAHPYATFRHATPIDSLAERQNATHGRRVVQGDSRPHAFRRFYLAGVAFTSAVRALVASAASGLTIAAPASAPLSPWSSISFVISSFGFFRIFTLRMKTF